jgi:hypothetical protein
MDRTVRAKRMLDIEDVLRWACQELAGRSRRTEDGGRRTDLRSLCSGGTGLASLVGRWTEPPGFPSISPMFAAGFAAPAIGAGRGAPPDGDSLLVEAAISGLPAAMALLETPAELAPDIGLEVDRDGAFAAAKASAAGLLLAHGRMGNRPAWDLGATAVGPRRAANGKPGTWRRTAVAETLFGDRPDARRTGQREFEEAAPALRKRDLYPDGAYCGLEFEPPPQAAVNARADYLAYVLALGALAEALSGRLESIAALPPAAAVAPWLGDRDGDRPRDLFRAGAGRVYSGREQRELAARRAASSRWSVAGGNGAKRRPARPACRKAENG